MMQELGFSIGTLNNGYAAGSASLAVGALIFIPFALKFGRRSIYIVSIALQAAVMIWSARINNVADLILTNMCNCILGALAEVIIQMTVAGLSALLQFLQHFTDHTKRSVLCSPKRPDEQSLRADYDHR